MNTFDYQRPETLASILQAHNSSAAYLAGGTTLIDLMRLDVMHPTVLIDINGLRQREADISLQGTFVRMGAGTRMAEAEAHPLVLTHLPVVAQSLQLAASPQLRNMATLGGNVLQRTRCSYFRDVAFANCNKRNPGSGCAALDGVNRKHAVLGVSDACIAAYPGDFAQALIALEASIDVVGSGGRRSLIFEALHLAPGNTPEVETTLRPGELIEAFRIPTAAWTKRSLYLKVRDRQSYEFALSSVAVALDMEGDTIREARIALGGVATKPWRAREAEARLVGKPAGQALFAAAADAAFAEAKPRDGNRFKIDLGKRTLVRALTDVSEMRV